MTAANECPTCHRPFPREKSDSPVKVRNGRFTCTVPQGEEGLLESLLEDIVRKYWDAGYHGPPPQSRGWVYPALMWSLQAVHDADLVPTE